jgi:hypothetical protein
MGVALSTARNGLLVFAICLALGAAAVTVHSVVSKHDKAVSIPGVSRSVAREAVYAAPDNLRIVEKYV